MFAHPGVRGLTARKERSSPESFVLMSYLPLHGMTSLRSGDLPFNSFGSEIRINFLLTRKSYQMNGFAIGITREPHCFLGGDCVESILGCSKPISMLQSCSRTGARAMHSDPSRKWES